MRIKLSLVPKILAPAVLAAAVLTPGAAGSTSAVNLAVLPLTKSAIGTVAKPLHLSRFSGPVSNAAASRSALGYSTPGTFRNLGRVSGYALDYGVAASGGHGVTGVLTSVEQYTSATAAKRGLAFWKKDDALYRQLNQGTFSVTTVLAGVPRVGQARFAYLTGYSAPNIVPLWTFRERVVEGRYVLQVDVSAGTAAAAKALAPELARKLDARLRIAANGHLHASPVKLPPAPTLGPPDGGPDISKFPLIPADLTGDALISRQHYAEDRAAISYYSSHMEPAGPFDYLSQNVYWYATANEAAFRADWRMALLLGRANPPLDLKAVGHGGQGVIEHTLELSVFSITVGHVVEEVTVWNYVKDIQSADVRALAQKLAERLDTLYTG